jgi:hypothetical protein
MEVLDSLLSVVRRCCEGFPDKRTGTNSQYTMADIGLAALSVFFHQFSFWVFGMRRCGLARVGEIEALLSRAGAVEA